MLITRVYADFLRLPLPRVRALPRAEHASALPPPDSLSVLLVRLQTDNGLNGLGFWYDFTTVGWSVRFALAAVDEMAPHMLGTDPRSHARLYTDVKHQLLPPVHLAFAAADIAVWDLAAKAAGMPLWQYLGGARDAAPAYLAETALVGLAAEHVLAIYEKARAYGISGLQVAIGGASPEADARKIETIRNEVGLDAWLGVGANGGYDAATALAMGRFLEEETDADWFEDPVPAEDLAGLRRLADKLELPLAAGSRFDRVSDFGGWVTDTAAGILRPDPRRLGGLSPTIQVINLAATFHRPTVPVLLPEVGVHLACGLLGARAVDYVSWLNPLWKSPPCVSGGLISPPPGLGLGLEPDEDAIAHFRVGS
jgi:L-alanine-DL-glutamate epimerase-like enolase superfamily enzyme